MHTVVIGGSGFVGRRLVEMLVREPRPEWPRFASVRVVDIAPLDPPIDGVTWTRADVRSRPALDAALAGAHTVFHLASVVDVSLRAGAHIDEVNVAGTRNVVEACRAQGVRALVYTSSEDVVLSETPVAGGDESLPYPSRPIHPYVRTKIAGERIALEADRQGGLRTVAVRPVHVYGPRDPHALVTSLRAFARGSVPFLLGDGTARFDVVYVDNVVHGHVLAAARLHDAEHADRVGGRAYIVGEDHAPNYFEWLRPYAASRGIAMPRRWLGRRGTALAARAMELFHRVTGRDVPFHGFHERVIGQDFFFSHARARRDLGYAPIVAPDEARARTIEWLRAQPI